MSAFSARRGPLPQDPKSKHRSMLCCLCGCAPEHMRCHLHQEGLTQHLEPWLPRRTHDVCTYYSGHRSISHAPFSRNNDLFAWSLMMALATCSSHLPAVRDDQATVCCTGNRESPTTARFHKAV